MRKWDELIDYCETNLAYLLDQEDFQVEVVMTGEDKKNTFSVIISNNPNERNLPLHTNDKLFNWDNVKDYIIPFLKRLDKDYDVSRIYFYEYSKGVKYGSYSTQQAWIGHSLNSIVKDKIKPGMIRVIDITVTDKTPDTLLKRIKRFVNF